MQADNVVCFPSTNPRVQQTLRYIILHRSVVERV